MQGVKEFIGEEEGLGGRWVLLLKDVSVESSEEIVSLLSSESIVAVEVAQPGNRRALYVAGEDARGANRVLRVILGY